MNSLLSKSLLLSFFAVSTSAFASDVAIVGARIEVGNGTVIPSGTILIHDNKISAVGESVTVPSGATTIDGKGLTVYPGFIDGYSTKGLKIPEQAAAGTPPDSRNTAPPAMWHENRKGIRSEVIAAKCLDLKSGLSDNYKQGITTALLAPGTGTIRGIASVVDLTEGNDVLLPMAAADMAFQGGSGPRRPAGATGTPPPQLYPGTLFGITALMRQTLADVQYYDANPPAKKDETLENLEPLLSRQMPAVFAADSSREIVRAARVADEFGIKLVVVGAREGYKQIDLLKRQSIPVIASLDIGSEPTLKPGTEPDSAPLAIVKERHDNWVKKSQNIKMLIDAGVPVAFTNSATGFDDYLKRVRAVIATGLSRDAALASMTQMPARILGVSDKVGTIEAGKLANLVVMNGDFADAKSEVQSVVVEGKKVDVKKGGAN